MRRATLRIVNRTAYRTDQLRAFAVRARAEVFGDDLKRLVVTFRPARKHHTGYAYVGGTNSVVRVPAPDHLDRQKLAQVLKHELAHNAGARGERWMRASRWHGWGAGWRETVTWALDLPLDVAAPATAPGKTEATENALAALAARRAKWIAKAKRAATALRKIARSQTYYERKLAAMRGK